MTIAQLLRQGTARLTNVSDSPALDAEVLLAYVLDLDRTKLLQYNHSSVDLEVEELYHRFLHIRQRGIPVAYLTGQKAFMDFELMVTPHTLIPRPFTETLVNTVLETLADQHHTVVDVGTGSGAIALSLAKHQRGHRIIATDTSVSALRVAAANARRHHLLRRIDFRVGSLLEPLRRDDHVTAIVANLPYLPVEDMNEPSIRHEPTTALHGGPEGLWFISQLIRQLRWFPSVKFIAFELLPTQVDTVAYLLRREKFLPESVTDGQLTRGLLGRK